jgi:hypothetical protein
VSTDPGKPTVYLTDSALGGSASDDSGVVVLVRSGVPAGNLFPIGQTTVTYTATDPAGNVVTATQIVTVVDIEKPTLTVPASVSVGNDVGKASAVVSFAASASDNSGAASLSCTSASGTSFALGTTTVTCTATDSSGNTGSGSFAVTVVDTAPPNLIPPGDRSVYATSDTGIAANDDGAAAFVGGASASDIVDPHPTITNDAPGFFGVGTTVVTFTARDASGNTRSATASLTVLPKPAEATTPAPLPPPTDRKPPDDVTNLAAVAGDGVVTLTWTPPKTPDFTEVEITRSTSDSTGADVVYHGNAAKFVDRAVQNGVDYRYVVVTIDKNGNRSTGVAVTAQPKRLMLRSPRDGAVVTKPPKLVWLPVDAASYYNVQLFRGNAKILSAWPAKPALLLRKSWKYNGRSYKLTADTYRWYVWPGFGPRADVNYGDLLGQSSFTVRR